MRAARRRRAPRVRDVTDDAHDARLSGGDVAALAGAFDLGAVSGWGEIAAGTININHWLEAGGRRWFVRVNQGKTEVDVRWEAELVAALAAAGVPTPVPRRTREGAPLLSLGGRLVSVFPWVSGHHREAGEVTAEDCAEVGRALAALHRAGGPLLARFSRDGIYTTGHMVQRHRDLLADPRATGDAAVAEALARVGQELELLAERAAERESAPGGVIHGDLFRDNVLFDRSGRLAALLDFEQASRGTWVYDLSVCLNAWCFDDGGEPDATRVALSPARARALLGGYQARRVLEAGERALLGVETRAAAARFTITRITDVYLPGAALPGKDFRRYLSRLDAWRGLEPGELAGWMG